MPKIFISYRRADSQTFTDRIYDRLAAAFGESNVFQDVDSIPAGADFRKVLRDKVKSSDIVLVIIGPQWATVTDEKGQRRLFSSSDFVRIEVETALNSQKVIIPVIMEGAAMPRAEDLPSTLHELRFRNAAKIRHNPGFKADMQWLIEQIKVHETELEQQRLEEESERQRQAELEAQAKADAELEARAKDREAKQRRVDEQAAIQREWNTQNDIAHAMAAVEAQKNPPQIDQQAILQHEQRKLADIAYAKAREYKPHIDEQTIVQAKPEILNPELSVPAQSAWRRFFSPIRSVIMVIVVIIGVLLLAQLTKPLSTAPMPTAAPTSTSQSVLVATGLPIDTVSPVQSTDSPSPTATNPLTRTSLPSPTQTETPKPTDTLAPTATETRQPTSTLSQTPTDSPSPTLTMTHRPTNTALPTPTETRQPTPILLPSPAIESTSVITHNKDWTPEERRLGGVEMVRVPAGCFDMGNDSQASYWDGTRLIQGVPDGGHICFKRSFWLDKTEVTNAQFAQFGGTAVNKSIWTEASHPRDQIWWTEANAFCTKRGTRLPTEAEWEYAARGPDNLIYPWGNDFEANNVVYSGNSNNQTASVGSRLSGASWVGALDMSGNVWEWVSTLYRPYPYPTPGSSEESQDWINPRATNSRTLRGGSAGNSLTSVLRAAYRNQNDPYFTNFTKSIIGFRCAASSLG